MDKYIIVKIRDADGRNGRFNSNMGAMRKAIHQASRDLDISAADMVTHTSFFPTEDSATVATIFETNMAKAKKAADEYNRLNPFKVR
jgi:hypothetical protein